MEVKEILRQFWGHETFRPLQEDIINSVMLGNDTLALLPTGGGKSICFQVPALAMDGICIVISPLIALMKDQVINLQNRGIKAVAIFAGMAKREIDIILDNCIYGDIKFLYLSPERLTTSLLKERIKHMNVNLLAVDEAHCISQWGYDFRPPYLQIVDFRTIHPNVPILALTASATNVVQQDIINKLKFANQHKVFKKSFERENLRYIVVNQENKLQKLVDVCNGVKGGGIVYVRTRKESIELSKYLNQNQILSDFYHAGLDLQERSLRQQAWLKNNLRVIVATNAFGMGIDKPDVRFVIHYEIPESLEAYYQEAGRAGRDEKKAFAVVLYHQRDQLNFERRYLQSFPELSYIKQTYHNICNYLQIHIGAGKEESYDFNIAELCSKYKMEVIPVLNAIKFLEHTGYFSLSENALLPSRLQFLVDGADIYKFQVENYTYDSLIKTVLRLYGGAFDQYIAIKEKDIAQKLQQTPYQIKEMLRKLNDLGVASYQEQTQQPYLTLLTERVPTQNVSIDQQYYQARKVIYKEKMEAMLAFVNLNVCRSQQILTYFNEDKSKVCGHCDVCIAHKHQHDKDFKQQIANEILYALKEKAISFHEIIMMTKKGSQKDRIEVLRMLLDDGLVIIENNFYRLSD